MISLGPQHARVASLIEDDNWKRSENFSRDDLPLVGKLADRVHNWIYEQTRAADGLSQRLF